MNTTNNTFKIDLIINYTIDANIAAKILASPFPVNDLNDFLQSNYPDKEGTNYNLKCIEDKLGKFLATRKVEECKQLTEQSTISA